MKDVMNYLKKKPELLKINAQYERNEGYLKSLAEDKKFMEGLLKWNVKKEEKLNPYNVSSGKGISIADYIMICKNLYDLDVPILIDPDRLRPSDVPILIGSNEKIKNEIGWVPLYPITKIMMDGIEYFMKHKEFLDIESH